MFKSQVFIASLAVFSSQIFAQGALVTELPTLKLELQTCSSIKKIDARSKCFEAVAVQAVGMIERIPVNQVSTEGEIKVDVEAQAKKKQDDIYRVFITKNKTALTSDFKDPSSAQWRGIVVSGNPINERGWFLCGEVNAKNSYGAYIGFRRFFASDVSGTFSILKDDDNIVFNSRWLRLCNKPLYDGMSETPASGSSSRS